MEGLKVVDEVRQSMKRTAVLSLSVYAFRVQCRQKTPGALFLHEHPPPSYCRLLGAEAELDASHVRLEETFQ